MNEQNDSFLFRREYHEALKRLPDDMAGRLYIAIADFMLDGIDTTFDNPVETSIWILLKPMLEQDLKELEEYEE